MFFNGKKLTNRTPRESRKYEFTDKFCRNYTPKEFKKGSRLSDSLCKNLNMLISEYGNHTYHFSCGFCDRTIGNVHTTSIKEAREIVQNIRDNIDEFSKEVPNIKIPLVFYFKKFGKFPHEPKGTEVIISNENSSLKKKIKDLEEEVARLNRVIAVYNARLDSIADYARSPLPTDDEKVIDVFGEDYIV